jgi:hypothetical protein
VATVAFTAEPGETKVGLSPWYTYADYIRYVSTLPDHPHLTKSLLGKSDAGREHWELTITDPAVPSQDKRTIFWHAREHAYESFSSFAIEGLVAFLLSDEAAAFRRKYVITLHPMTNVDGVAHGFEYRGGYDFPKPRTAATGRLTFETIDRLHPDFAVAWHNWVAPRDRDVVFYTDGEGDQAMPRAWLRFAQLFRSPRAAGHRWKDETTPLRYNWHGRNPLIESNLHQYAMKKYGTRIWGWEMPWWRRNVEDARRDGAAFARAFLTTIDELHSASVPAAIEDSSVEVPRWGMHEFSANAVAHVANPFREASLVGEFTSPSSKTRVVDGFYDGGDTWRLRFAPDEEGEWTYLLRGEGVEILRRGKLICTAPRGHGFIRIHPENPYAFAYSDGTPFFPMGDTCYGLHDDSPITPVLRAEYLKVRRSQQFNFVRMHVGGSHPRAETDAAYWAWGGTAQKPDLDRFNPAFFGRLDAVIREMGEARMNLELILLNFYRRPFTDAERWSPERERLWLRYLIARYAAYDNVFLWTIANEYETHPDGKYRLDYPADVNWARETAGFIKANDPWQHLVTVHPVISASRQGDSPRSPIAPPWRIGEFFGDCEAIDVLSQQTGQNGEGAVWDESRGYWTGDMKDLTASVSADRRYKKPVLNSENGYEYLSGHPNEKKQVHHTDKVRRSSWRIVCAGGYFAAGFNGTIGHSDVWNRLDAPNHYTFELKDEGAASQLAALHQFFSALPYSRMQPTSPVAGDAVVLADPGNLYVAYLPHGGPATLDLSASKHPLKARWFDPRNGRLLEAFDTKATPSQPFTAPDSNDWTLLVESSR